MLTLKASVATAILVGTAAASAGAGYLVTNVTMRANVTLACPGASSPSVSTPTPAHSFPPLGNVPSTTGGKQW
jgi:hypothetical protein